MGQQGQPGLLLRGVGWAVGSKTFWSKEPGRSPMQSHTPGCI